MKTRFHQSSINDLICRLEEFEPIELKKTCFRCSKDYKALVDEVIQAVESYLEGLCLDCINTSRFRHATSDGDYWAHRETYKRGGTICRIKHGDPTWYWSYAGTVQRRNEMMPRRGRHDYDSD